MDISIGLPTTVSGVTGDTVLAWARRAERRGFAAVSVLDRLAYPSLDSIVTLAAVAGATERIRLATTILIAPYRGSTAVVAKQLAALAALAPGRLTVGLSGGGRDDDYLMSGADYHRRGAELNRLLDALHKVWDGDPAGLAPAVPVARPDFLIGGHSPAALRRVARAGDGWIAGGSTAAAFAQKRADLLELWSAAGRPGVPRTAALGYFGLDPAGHATGEAYLARYYSHFPAGIKRVLEHTARSADGVRETVSAFEDAGCDELFLFPTTADPDEVDRLADVLQMSAVSVSPNETRASDIRM